MMGNVTLFLDPGLTEIYKDYKPDGKINYLFCCKLNSEGERKEKGNLNSCTISECMNPSKMKGNLCPIRTVFGRKLNLVEVTRDKCSGGSQGLCCRPNTKEGLLTLTLKAEKGEFPFYAKLGVGGSLCGSSIYNERHLITASHCVLNPDGSLKNGNGDKVFVNVDIENVEGESYEVEKYIPHPDSGFSKNPYPNYVTDDVAIIKLKKDINFNDNVQAIPLAERDLEPLDYSDEAIIIGIGTTDTLTIATTLQKANSILKETADAMSETGYDWAVEEYGPKEIYVGGIKDGKMYPGPGQGDSGGPMICRDKKGFAVLCGAYSSGWNTENCENNLNGENCKPAKYMRISKYVDWIESVAGDQNSAKVMKQPLYGVAVPKTVYNHQVRILRQGRDPCGGTLIERDLIATAAHCVFDDNGNERKDISVYYGIRKSDGSKRGTEFGVKGRKALEGFRKGQRKVKRIARYNVMGTPREPYYQNDLALVRLSAPAVTSSVKLPKIGKATRSNYDEKPVWHSEVALPFPQTKAGGGREQQRLFKLLDNKSCQKRLNWASYLGYTLKLDDNVMCGVEKFNGGSQCDRELGGGLFCDGPEGKASVLCGVQVFRFCQLAMPGAYLDIGKYSEWIETTKSQI